MKKNLLSLAVAASAAGIAGVASAQMYLNAEGTGEALVYALYSADGGNDTYVHIVNTTDQAKAVKVRMVEGEESLETLDFNLYMSPLDHYGFVITVDGEGAKIDTADNSCTVPTIPEGGQPFSTLLWAADSDNPTAAESNRTRTGYIEVIEMGQIVDASDTYADILHGATGEPGDCAQLTTNWTSGGAWYEEADADLVGNDPDTGKPLTLATVGVTDFDPVWNGGGLYGVATVINVAEGTAFGYDAAAIEDLVEAAAEGSVLHYPPGDTRPDFDDPAMADTATVNVNGAQTTYSKAIISQNYGPVSAVFMTASLSNDYVVDPAIGALTDWIVTMPTKSNHWDGTDLDAPFTNTLGGEALTGDNLYCQPVGMTAYDREEQEQDQPVATPEGPGFSPSVRPDPEDPVDWLICNETNIVHFNATTSAVNGPGTLLADASGFVGDWPAGWAVMGLTEASVQNTMDNPRTLPGAVGGQNGAMRGLPVTGFAVVEYVNGNVGGTKANYQSAWVHKTDVVASD